MLRRCQAGRLPTLDQFLGRRAEIGLIRQHRQGQVRRGREIQ
jgi:hypothetical protein